MGYTVKQLLTDICSIDYYHCVSPDDITYEVESDDGKLFKYSLSQLMNMNIRNDCSKFYIKTSQFITKDGFWYRILAPVEFNQCDDEYKSDEFYGTYLRCKNNRYLIQYDDGTQAIITLAEQSNLYRFDLDKVYTTALNEKYHIVAFLHQSDDSPYCIIKFDDFNLYKIYTAEDIGHIQSMSEILGSLVIYHSDDKIPVFEDLDESNFRRPYGFICSVKTSGCLILSFDILNCLFNTYNGYISDKICLLNCLNYSYAHGCYELRSEQVADFFGLKFKSTDKNSEEAEIVKIYNPDTFKVQDSMDNIGLSLNANEYLLPLVDYMCVVRFNDGFKKIARVKDVINDNFRKTRGIISLDDSYVSKDSSHKCRCNKCKIDYLMTYDEMLDHELWHHLIRNPNFISHDVFITLDDLKYFAGIKSLILNKDWGVSKVAQDLIDHFSV